jgi:1,2-diacylglycerol 3-beta-galactosyltransferase
MSSKLVHRSNSTSSNSVKHDVLSQKLFNSQEAGNVPYVVENGCGKFSKSPKQIANIVADWFGPKSDEFRIMSQNCLKLARPDAVFKIVHDLHELVRQKCFTPQYS